MNTPDLFEHAEAHARATDPETSHEAAAEIAGAKVNQMEQRALSALQAARPDGLTNHELVLHTGLPWNTISPRIRPLVRKGWVIDSGLRRPGPTGKRCIVWKAAIL